MAQYANWNSNENVTFINTSRYEYDMNMSDYSMEYWYNYYYGEYQEVENTSKASIIDVFSIALSILGILANSFSIFIVKRINKRLSTHLKLIVSLCFSDCLILVPCLFKNIFIMTHQVNVCVNIVARLITDLALLASLLNLLAIAVDHYLAILRPLLYKKCMTNFRGICAVLVIWIASIIAISIEIIMGVIHQQEMEPLCEAIAYDKTNSELGIVSFIFVVLFVICVVYARIYICVVRNQSTHSKIRHRQKDTSNIKALVTTSLFVLTFVIFWTPIGIFNVFMYNVDVQYSMDNLEDIILAGQILYVILMLNSIADPIIYTFRLPQVHRRCFKSNNKMKRQSTKMITLTSEA